MPFFDRFLSAELYGFELHSIAYGLIATVGSYLLMRLVLGFVVRRLGAIARHSVNQVDDVVVEVLEGTSRWLLLLAAVLIGLGFLDLSARWHDRVSQLWFVALALQIGLWFTRAAAIGQRLYEEKHGTAGAARTTASATLVSWAVRTIVWATVLLAMLSNMGVNITAFVTSLGVGGIAIALAVQNVLGDIFASFAIAVDKPFEVGDGIGFGDTSGSVEFIGLKTTRLRAPSGEQIVVGNTDLLKQVVRNYKRMTERRIPFNFGLAYDATPDQLEKVPGIVKAAIEAHEELRFDRAHFKGFGESTLDFEVVYFVRTPDYLLFMDLQQTLNLRLMRDFAELGVEFAFPTRTVVLTRAQKPAAA